jgi:hypothetical protein
MWDDSKSESVKVRPMEVDSGSLPHAKIKDVIDGCLVFEASERYTFVEIEKEMSKILGELRAARNEKEMSKNDKVVNPMLTRKRSSIDMTLTLTRSVKPDTKRSSR